MENAMTAEERGRKWIEELEEVEKMTSTQLRQAVTELAKQQNFCRRVAREVLTRVGYVQ